MVFGKLIKKLYFKLIFNSVTGDCGPLFLRKDFNHSHFVGLLSGGFWHESFCPVGFCPGGGVIS